ncbi:MAG: hypothetical protein QOI73_3600 [Solirubrobacteraceae bacterium]|nr:hypothetical protein [Solirubrobacteraceae bacterium]
MADSRTQTDHRPAATTRAGEHAIVIGASMAGLLAARVLSDSYERVTVLDRDALPEGLTQNRRAVPQGRHAHGLQLGGQAALADLFPGFTEETLAEGAAPLKPGVEMRFCIGGHDLPRVPVGTDGSVASRPLLEGLVRRRVAALSNVTIRDRAGVSGLVADGDRIRGVTLKDGREQQTLLADLVVAASGRGAKLPAWLEALGYERPAEERVDVDVKYSSCVIRLRAGAVGDDKVILNAARPGRARGVAALIEPTGDWNVTLYGYGPDHHPPTDYAGFVAFAATVADAQFAGAIAQAEQIGEIATFGYPAVTRRRYDRLRRFPEGLIVTGDAMCSFNPTYGQGMTVAALEAVALRDCLRKGSEGLARRFHKAAQGPVDHAWKLSTGADLAMPEIDAVAPLPDRVIGRYMERLIAAAGQDEVVAAAFFEVTGMIAPVTKLLSPAIARRVLRAAMRTRRGAVRRPAMLTPEAAAA